MQNWPVFYMNLLVPKGRPVGLLLLVPAGLRGESCGVVVIVPHWAILGRRGLWPRWSDHLFGMVCSWVSLSVCMPVVGAAGVGGPELDPGWALDVSMRVPAWNVSMWMCWFPFLGPSGVAGVSWLWLIGLVGGLRFVPSLASLLGGQHNVPWTGSFPVLVLPFSLCGPGEELWW